MTDWLDALTDQGLDVTSAKDALAVKGWLDTGNYSLNWAISGRFLRGYPLGHTVEIFGDSGTGKSFLVARALAMVQAAGGVALLDDSEGAYNLDWIPTLGVNPESLAYRRSRTVEEHLATALGFIEAYRKTGLDVPGVLALDGIAQLSTDHELDVKLEKRDFTKASGLKAFFRIVSGDLINLPVVHISTNHVIANIGNPWKPRTTPGGGGPKYQASVRIDLRSTSKVKEGSDYKGVICKARIDKNRIVAPWKEVRLAIPFEQPISRTSGLIPVLLDLGVLEKKGNYLAYEGESLGIHAYVSKNSFLKQDESGEELLDQIPGLLEEADEMLAQKSRTARRLSGTAVEVEEEDE